MISRDIRTVDTASDWPNCEFGYGNSLKRMNNYLTDLGCGHIGLKCGHTNAVNYSPVNKCGHLLFLEL